MRSRSQFIVYAALVGNVLVALTKTAAAAWTGSSAMTSEAVHSFVDTLNEILLLHGMRRSHLHGDPEHPLGYGRELYFWSFIVALLVFALGAAVAIAEGVDHIRHPHPIQDPFVNYIVFAAAFVFEGTTWLLSFRQFRSAKGNLGFYEAIRRSKDPPSFIVLLEDSAALLGIAVAVVGTSASVALNQPALDGVASIVIGLLLAGTAAVLARESKSLLIGEQADARLQASIVAIADAQPAIEKANGLITVQLAPDQVVVALSVEFADNLSTPEIEDAVVALEKAVRASHPEVVMLFVKPQSPGTFRARWQNLVGDPDDEKRM